MLVIFIILFPFFVSLSVFLKIFSTPQAAACQVFGSSKNFLLSTRCYRKNYNPPMESLGKVYIMILNLWILLAPKKKPAQGAFQHYKLFHSTLSTISPSAKAHIWIISTVFPLGIVGRRSAHPNVIVGGRMKFASEELRSEFSNHSHDFSLFPMKVA